ncbi:MAG: TetR/AcrR family transcriptional regulator [Desulfobacterales bacterium]|nr:TetR/AcrR family transcriptional regulator [Desulfobacterales bacterium]
MPPIAELEAIRKKQILEAGLIAISERGSANVTMDDICQAAGLSKGGLAHYYRSKKDLFKAVFQYFFERIFQRSEATMAQYKHPLDRVLSFDWLYNRDDPTVNVGYPLLFDIMAISVRDTEHRAIFHDWIDNWVGLLKEALEQGIAEGTFKNLDDPEATARAISAIYQGIGARWYLDSEAHSREWAVSSFKKAIRGLLLPHMTSKQILP